MSVANIVLYFRHVVHNGNTFMYLGMIATNVPYFIWPILHVTFGSTGFDNYRYQLKMGFSSLQMIDWN